jgi:hypothetical protein
MLCDIDTATLSRECVIIQTSGVVLDTPLAKRGIDTLLSASNPAHIDIRRRPAFHHRKGKIGKWHIASASVGAFVCDEEP